jgi:hypothetical protein
MALLLSLFSGKDRGSLEEQIGAIGFDSPQREACVANFL